MRVVIAGAGMTGRRLMSKLAADHYDVVAIDLNRDVCEMVSAKLGVSAICGNATDVATLEEAEIEQADVAVGMMHQSADNLAFSLLSKSSGVKRVITRMANPKYAGAYLQAGVTTVIDVTGLFLDRLVLEIERPEIHEIASFGAGAGTIIGVTVPEKSHIVGRTVRDVMSDKRYPKDCLIVGIFRGETERLVIPNGTELIGAGDQLVLCALTATAKDIPQYFETRKGISSLFGGKRSQTAPRAASQTQVELDSALEEGENESQGVSK